MDELSVGDNTSTASNIGHESNGDAASGDIDICKEKSGTVDCGISEFDDDKFKNKEGEATIVDYAAKSEAISNLEKNEYTVTTSSEIITEAVVTGDAKIDLAKENSASAEINIYQQKPYDTATNKQVDEIDFPPTEVSNELGQDIENLMISNTDACKKTKIDDAMTTQEASILHESNIEQHDVNNFGGYQEINDSSDVASVNSQANATSTVTHNSNGMCSTSIALNDKTSEDMFSKQSNCHETNDKRQENNLNELNTIHNKSLVTNAILNPLVLETPSSSNHENAFPPEKLTFSPSRHKMLDTETPCMLCDHIESNMDSKSHYDEYLCHLIVEHKLVIADVKLIADLQSYAIYWKKRFSEEPLETFCSKIKTNTGSNDVGESEEYYLLCDALPEDKQIREKLQFEKLKKLLLRQEFERNDESFSRACPFCRRLFQGNRIILFNHMTIDHNFNIGHPDNIVNVRELLDAIQEKLDRVQCLFCEHSFPDRAVLREHMRKKGHRRLNPENKDFDKYYMINYLELGKNWLKLQSEPEKLDANSDDWSGWFEESQKAYCFFCKSSFTEAGKVYEHMNTDHGFDFIHMREEMHLSFYQQIKLINYIRRQVHLSQKDGCSDIATKIKEDLQSNTKWNQPQYYFSTYEDDTLLCQLEDKEDVFEPEDNFVIGEDGIDCRAVISNSVLTDLVVRGVFDT